MVQTVYAKVDEHGRIDQIYNEKFLIANSKPLSDYVKGFAQEAPPVTHAQYLQQQALIDTQGVLQVSWVVKTYTLDELINRMSFPFNAQDLTQAIVDACEAFVDEQLDLFAQKKGYKNMDRLVSFVTSTVASYSYDASFATQLRDQVWIEFYKLMDQFKARELQLSNSAQLLQRLPSLVWPD